MTLWLKRLFCKHNWRKQYIVSRQIWSKVCYLNKQDSCSITTEQWHCKCSKCGKEDDIIEVGDIVKENE